MKRVVITGMGALTPIGNNIEEYFNGLKNGVSGCDKITYFDTTNFKTKFACELKDFDIADFMHRKESRKLDLFAQYAMVAADQAVNDAGITDENIDKEKVGVIWSSGIGGFSTIFNEIKSVNQLGLPKYNPFFIPKLISDIAAGHISIKYGLQGPNFAVTSACSSSTNGIVEAVNNIKLGKAIAFVAGGSEAAICEPGIGGFNSMQAISTNNEEYKSASRPFDESRDGFVMGEGAGALFIEEYEHAVKRGATIYAEIVGTGAGADAHHITAPHPEGEGAYRVMKYALEDANIKPEDIDYINTHGTATPLGDIAEIKAIVKLFGEHAYNLNISSTKSMTGHLLGAAGVIEVLASVMAVRDNVVPPTINIKKVDKDIDQKLNLTVNKAQEKEVTYAISNTFGFGGHNASIIVKKFNQ